MLLAAAVTVLALLPASGTDDPRTVRIGAITWYTNLDQALQIAGREHRPLWVHFGENPG